MLDFSSSTLFLNRSIALIFTVSGCRALFRPSIVCDPTLVTTERVNLVDPILLAGDCLDQALTSNAIRALGTVGDHFPEYWTYGDPASQLKASSNTP